MLPLKPFDFLEPQSLAELTALLGATDRRLKIMAGGTDLLPNLKHGLYDVDAVVSLKRIPQLNGIIISNENIALGALVRISDITKNPHIKSLLPSLARASSQIASPQIRNMGTVGGNICLDTRCLYFNQSEFWRSALGYCLKRDGQCCHVVKTGKRCVAAASNDLATALLAHGAKVTIACKSKTSEIELANFYTANGIKNNILAPDQVVTSIAVDIPKSCFGGFFKLRHRNSIDFPMLSLAVALTIDQNRCLTSGTLVVNALVAKPKVVDLSEFKGFTYNRKLVTDMAQWAESISHPQTNICDDPAWRKNMVAYSAKLAFNDALLVTD